MKNILTISLTLLVLVSGAASAGGDSSDAVTGSARFSTGEQTYLGNFATSDKSISVDIDGLTYKGNYASIAEDSAGSTSGAITGNWGRAFLFASSAKTLRCQLDAGFPKVSGQCKDASGRQFLLKPGAEQQAAAAH